MTTVELERVCKFYDGVAAVNELSFSLASGQVFGLLGPNGAGKTSTIRMTIGITRPDRGEVRLFGEPFQRRSLDRVGFLPEERGLYRKATVRENLTLLGQLAGLSAYEALTRARRWTVRFGIEKWLERRVDEMSKGMQQRVQFIAALAHEPEFIVLDEPFSGLDPVSANEIKDLILELKGQGRTIMLSTHRMDQVEKLCDAICLIDHGRALLRGSLREIKASYGSKFVQIDYQGEDRFLDSCPMIESSNVYGNHAELKLKRDSDPQELMLLAARSARITRFEVMEPSLEQIFIDQVANHA